MKLERLTPAILRRAEAKIRARRQPRAARRVGDLVHQIRQRELEIAFLGEVKP